MSFSRRHILNRSSSPGVSLSSWQAQVLEIELEGRHQRRSPFAFAASRMFAPIPEVELSNSFVDWHSHLPDDSLAFDNVGAMRFLQRLCFKYVFGNGL